MRSLRIDDLGASSKQYEVYSHVRGLSRTPLKWLPRFRAWGPYPEISLGDLVGVFAQVFWARSRITLGITACWVEADGTLVPYPEKFPEHAGAIAHWVRLGTVEVANHGLTHCQVGKHVPVWWKGNREQHREFLHTTSVNEVAEHLEQSQRIFKDWLGFSPTLLVPPGLLFPEEQAWLPKLWGLRLWTRADEANCLTYHDRDFVLGDGMARLRVALEKEKFTACQ